MTTAEIVPFADEHVEGAAAVLAERLERQRAAEPLLVDDDATAAVRALLERGAAGAAAVVEGEVHGFVLAGMAEDDLFGRHAWVEGAGSATRDPELLRDVYASLAGAWVEDRYRRHFVEVPALPGELDPWYRLGFHQMHVQVGVRETDAERPGLPAGLSIRESGIEDLDETVHIDVLIFEYQQTSPSFGLMDREADMDERREGWAELLKDERYHHYVAEIDRRVVGHTGLIPLDAEFGIPRDAIQLASTAVDPAMRGHGIGEALTRHALAEAAALGHPSIRTDWRVTNLLASRFWPARGFRPVYLRLHRAVGIG